MQNCFRNSFKERLYGRYQCTKYSKCIDLVPNLTHFEFIFKVPNLSKCFVTHPSPNFILDHKLWGHQNLSSSKSLWSTICPGVNVDIE